MRGEAQLAVTDLIARAPVERSVVVLDRGQRLDAAAGVDSEQRVEITATGVDRDVAVRGRGPAPPDRVSARDAGVIRLAGLVRGVHVGARGVRGQAAQRRSIGEVVIGRSGCGSRAAQR